MGKAKKLPSGSWRCRATWTDEKGKRHSKSFTSDTKYESEALAASFLKDLEYQKKPENKTLGDAADIFINSNSNILSPSTIVGYKKIRNTALQDIINVKLGRITLPIYQSAINDYSKNHAPKTVLNAHAFFSNILKINGISFGKDVNLPQKVKTKIKIPETDEVQEFLSAIRDTKIYEYVLLSICLGLRRSEIMGLHWSDIDFEKQTIEIQRALVINEDKIWIEKTTKTISGTRTLFMPDVLITALKEKKAKNKDTKPDDRVFQETPPTLHKIYCNARDNNNFPYRFHDLRHYHASILNAAGLPNKYAMERMGHATDNMLKEVYQHTMKSKNMEFDIIINNIMTDTFSNKENNPN